MQQINIYEAKTHLSTLVEKAAAGEPFIITKSGCPLVMVSSYKAEIYPRTGFLKNKIVVPDDFNEMGNGEVDNLFENML
jgi:prevent-host-death family protein